ncbi:MAG TPA: metalloregulator ArsR/SmtB family transcription factor [Terriglobales bacterium]|nr:metalloregulator ArsR/SmtB family transcription factor [Terriglobales bacterium]
MKRVLQAVADPTRRRILQVLKERGSNSNDRSSGLCASDIEQKVKVAQPTVSHHMRVLKNAGLIEAKKQGQWIWYRRNERAIAEFARNLRDVL